MIRVFFFVLVLVSFRANAQSPNSTDSLLLIKDYLLTIKNTVNSKIPEKQKIAKLDSLIRTATKQKAVFERNLNEVVKNKQEAETMKTSLNFILQSMVLYKSDIKNSQPKSARTEILYLNKNITILTNKIAYYCKSTIQS